MQSYIRKHHYSVLTHLNPVSLPMKTPAKKSKFLHHFLYFIQLFLEKWIILIYHSPVRYFLNAGKSHIEVFWVWPTSQLAWHRDANTNMRMGSRKLHSQVRVWWDIFYCLRRCLITNSAYLSFSFRIVYRLPVDAIILFCRSVRPLVLSRWRLTSCH